MFKPLHQKPENDQVPNPKALITAFVKWNQVYFQCNALSQLFQHSHNEQERKQENNEKLILFDIKIFVCEI